MGLFPRAFDNDYRGQWLALWLFMPVLAMKILIGVNIGGFNPVVSNRHILETVDGIPLSAFGAEAAQTVVFFGASWGLNMVILSALALIALIRYRAMLPLMILLFAVEQIGRKVMGAHYFPAEEGAAMSIGAMINWGFTAALAIGFVLSLIPRRRRGL